MPVEHNAITDAELHELKGAAGAAYASVPCADGAGSHHWIILSPHGELYYDDIGTGTTITTPTSYTVIAPTTTLEVAPKEVTSNSLGRLTYTGTPTHDFYIDATVTLKHSTGGGNDCFFQIHKNGSPLAGGQVVNSADSANYGVISVLASADAVVTNDYFEIFCKVSSGSITVHAFTLRIQGQE
jgi:hypothetical protein